MVPSAMAVEGGAKIAMEALPALPATMRSLQDVERSKIRYFSGHSRPQWISIPAFQLGSGGYGFPGPRKSPSRNDGAD